MKLLSLNLRHDVDHWPERSKLIIEELIEQQPDIIAFQEVALSIKQAHWIAKHLNAAVPHTPYEIRVEKKGGWRAKEGIGILSRPRIVEHHRIMLPEGRRVAQHVRVKVDGKPVDLINTHLHHLPDNNESVRLKQIKVLLKWMFAKHHNRHWILVGDFNASPDSQTVAEVRKHLASAYAALHGAEPEFTSLTPLIKGLDYTSKTLDYIFYDPSGFRMNEVRLVFTEPHPEDRRLYPSDHYGLLADFNTLP